jgi:hypothetical protein
MLDQSRNELHALQNRNADLEQHVDFLESQLVESEVRRQDVEVQLQLQLQLEEERYQQQHQDQDQQQQQQQEQQQQQQQQARKKRRLPTNSSSSVCENCGCHSNSSDSNPPGQQEQSATAGVVPPPLAAAKGRAPSFAARENPITLPHGEIDGRSNPQMAWEHRYQLLTAFKEEYGHLLTYTRPIQPQYSRLTDWLMKQRGLYRKFQKGLGSKSGRITQTRIDLLTQLGLNWNLPVDSWHEVFVQLTKFHATYGHCCVLAVQDTDGNDDFDFMELKRFVAKNRGYLVAVEKGATKSTRIDSHGRILEAPAPEDEDDDNDGENDNDGSDDDEQEEDDDESDDDHENAQQKKKKSTNQKKPAQYRYALPKFWSDEFVMKLQSIKCDYLHSAKHRLRPDKAQLKLRYEVNNNNWYTLLEEFRDYYNEHGHGFVETNKVLLGLGRWTKDQRTIYDAMTSTCVVEDNTNNNNTNVDTIREESRPVYERNIALLKDIGFCFDRDVLQAREDRIRKEQAERLAAERKKTTSLGQLEAAQNEKDKVRVMMAAARAKAKEADLELKEVCLVYGSVKSF